MPCFLNVFGPGQLGLRADFRRVTRDPQHCNTRCGGYARRHDRLVPKGTFLGCPKRRIALRDFRSGVQSGVECGCSQVARKRAGEASISVHIIAVCCQAQAIPGPADLNAAVRATAPRTPSWRGPFAET